MDAGTIEALIRAGLPDAEVEIDDVRGDGQHYAARVVSPQFRGLSRVEQHRLVFKALEGHIGQDIHALQLTTRSGDELSGE
ncbi:MAG: BolA/IbaG family iron-sulfur metabolism protein [Alphaproteobacteria bacterium]|nr:BolA/IbaG family iron-sulfur metabolism protein [Alphaproteobacteria bacterium]